LHQCSWPQPQWPLHSANLLRIMKFDGLYIFLSIFFSSLLDFAPKAYMV
jgi:hypothetical protein